MGNRAVIGRVRVCAGFFLDGAGPSLLTQIASEDWPATTGIITHSDVNEESNVASYQVDGARDTHTLTCGRPYILVNTQVLTSDALANPSCETSAGTDPFCGARTRQTR